MKNSYKLLLALVTCAVSISVAAAPLKTRDTIKLKDFEGDSCLSLMIATVKPRLDTDFKTEFAVADFKTIKEAGSQEFDPIVYSKVTRLLKGGEEGLKKLIDSLAGQKVTQASMPKAIGDKLRELDLLPDPSKLGLASVSLAPFISIASGAGTTLKINEDNYCCHVMYKPGSEDLQEQQKAVKSGRSFGESGVRKALDPADTYFLVELAETLNTFKRTDAFYKNLLNLLARNDASDYSELDGKAQTVSTDFETIYMAELDRYIMTGLKTHPWMNDLAEVTFVSAYGTEAGKIFKGGKLVNGTPKDYFGVGRMGSGIGETRRDRRALQQKISAIIRKLHPDLVKAVEDITGPGQSGDVYRGLMEFLNDPSKKAELKKNSTALVEAFVKFLSATRADADAITKAIESGN